MNKTISKLNSLNAEKILCIGVGVPCVFFDKIKGNVTGVDKWDYKSFPRSWSVPTIAGNIKTKHNKEKYNLVIINNSKHYSDLLKDFTQAQKSVKEGGIIAITHTMPKSYNDIREDYLPRQDWSGWAWQVVLDLISLGGYKVTSYDFEKGLTLFEFDETIKAKHVDCGTWEDWFVNRIDNMNNH